jgi:ABC-type nitrate/sulfonate/bicarbonate transport system substrate-binding protein
MNCGRRMAHGVTTVMVATILLTLAVGISPSGASVGHKTKRLSLSSINVYGGTGGTDFLAYWSAQAQGYYKKQGLNVTFVNTTATGAGMITLLVSGTADFIVAGAFPVAAAISAGGTMKSIFAGGYGPPDEIAINSTYAAAHNIPSSSSALAQLHALKGTHITIATTNTSATAYVNLIYAATEAGLTIGVNDPNADVDVVLAGTLGNLTAGLASGKFVAIDNSPPTTVVAGTIEVQGWKVPSLRAQPTAVLTATDAMIKAHRDTVQALVTASTQGWQYALRHPAGALRVSTPYYVNLGFTSPEEIQFLVADQLGHNAATPAITDKGYAALKSELAVTGTPITFPKSAWINNKYVDNAISALGYRVGSSP